MSLKNTLIAQYLLCALLPLVVLSLFLISSFRNIQVEEQVTKQQALSDSVMLATKFTLEQASQNLLQISRDTNVALAGQSGLFGYSAANALKKYVSDSDFVSSSILVDSKNMIVEASPSSGLLLDTSLLTQLGLLSKPTAKIESSIEFIDSLELTQAIYRSRKTSSSENYRSTGIVVLSAPLYLSETVTLDSRSTYTGRVVAFLLLDDMIKMVEQRSASLMLKQLSINGVISTQSLSLIHI